MPEKRFTHIASNPDFRGAGAQPLCCTLPRLDRIKRHAVLDECFRDKVLMSKWIDGNKRLRLKLGGARRSCRNPTRDSALPQNVITVFSTSPTIHCRALLQRNSG